MTEMLKIVHFKTVQNIFVAILIVALLNTVVYNVFDNAVLLGMCECVAAAPVIRVS